MNNAKIEYRIIGRFVKDEKPHVLDWNRQWTKADAERRMKEIISNEERAKSRGKRVDSVGMLGVETPYYSDYALVDIKIQSREVTAWN